MSDTLNEAVRWAVAGVAAIPIRPREKQPARPWAEYQSRLPTYGELVTWFGDGSALNIAVVCGWQGLAVLDFDSRDAWDSWLSWARVARPVLAEQVPGALQTVTARGRHLYALLAQPAKTRPMPSLGIDVKAAGGYVLVPPSVHPSGAVYRYVDADAPILRCESLADLLPADALPAAPEPAAVLLPSIPAEPDDPWAAAEQARDIEQRRGVAWIKEQHRIEHWFPGRVPTSGDGRWWLAMCPFHRDTQPSFWIDARRQLCGCYAGCTSKPLDVINLFGRLTGVGNSDAVRLLSRAAAQLGGDKLDQIGPNKR